MQTNKYTSETYQSKPLSADLIPSHNNFPLNPQSPVSSNHYLPSKRPINDSLTD